MATHASAKKRIRQVVRRTAVNRSRISRIRTFIKNVEMAIESGDAAAAKLALQAAQPEIMRAAQRRILHRNTASRKISRRSARIKGMEA